MTPTFRAHEQVNRGALRTLVLHWDDLPVSVSVRAALDTSWTERGREHTPCLLVRAYLDACAPAEDAPSLGVVAVEYRRAIGTSAGRQYAAGPSLQTLPRVAHHTIARGLYTDIDKVNAPTLLAQYCSQRSIPAPTIRRYAVDRSAMLAELGGSYEQGKAYSHRALERRHARLPCPPAAAGVAAGAPEGGVRGAQRDDCRRRACGLW